MHDMISLINFGRVYRYLLKPLDPRELRRDINAAAAHHLYLRSNPELAKRQEAVNQMEQTAGSEKLDQSFGIDRISLNRKFNPVDSST